MDTTTTLTPSEVIDRVRRARHDEHEACLRQVRLAVSWALLHPCPADEWPAHWGDPSLDEEVMPLAGEGAPWVAEYAPADPRRRPGREPGRGTAPGRGLVGAPLPAPAVVGPGPGW